MSYTHDRHSNGNDDSMASSVAGSPGRLSIVSADSDQLCVVCNDVSSGKHYGAVTCEGCKGFFRRIICFQNVYTCSGQGPDKDNCPISNDSSRRKCCKSCRYKRCLAVGMRAELCVKIDGYRNGRNDTDSDDSMDPVVYGPEELKAFRMEVNTSFKYNIHLGPNEELIVCNNNKQSNAMLMNKLRLSLETNVRQFVSHIQVFRELSPRLQQKLIDGSMNELFVLMIVSNWKRYRDLIASDDLYFGDHSLDATFRSLIKAFNEMHEWMAKKNQLLRTNGYTQAMAKDMTSAALCLMSVVNNAGDGTQSDRRVDRVRDRIVLAYELNGEDISFIMSRVLDLLTEMNTLFARNNYFC